MATPLKPGWSKPSAMLFATEVPTNEKAFEFAIAQAREVNATLILLHVYDTLSVSASNTSGNRFYDHATADSVEKRHLEPMAMRVLEAGVQCEVVVRSGLPADEILSFVAQREIDRIVMGTHSPGPVSKLLVGSVAEAVLRSAPVPVCVVGPQVESGARRDFATRTIQCAVSLRPGSGLVASFAAELAGQREARLVLQHVIRPQDLAGVLSVRSLDDIETDLGNLVSAGLREKIQMQTIVVPGDPTEELLYQSRAQQADLIVLGAHDASAFAAVTRHGVVYKTLAHSHCPVITLSPVVLGTSGTRAENPPPTEQYFAGVI